MFLKFIKQELPKKLNLPKSLIKFTTEILIVFKKETPSHVPIQKSILWLQTKSMKI